MEDEIWKTIPISLKYEASTHGRIRRIKTGRILKSHDNGTGYIVINIKGTLGENITRYLHRLVAITFIENSDNKPTVNHIDHDPSNNHVSNLEWSTRQEQIKHSRKRKLTAEEKGIADTRGVRNIWKCDPETGERLEMFSTIREAAASSHKKKSMSEIYTVAEDHEIRSSIETLYPCIKTAIGFSWEFDELRTIKSEEWKDIDPVHVKGFTGYKISTLGRILNNKGKVKSPRGQGYPCHSVGGKQYKSHRLVALTFLPIVDEKVFVNHIDGKKYNPIVDNLEFCSQSENIQHAHDSGLIMRETKKVWQYDLKGNFIKEFNSAKEAKDELGNVCASNIPLAILRGGSSGGFIWKRPSDDKIKVVKPKIHKAQKVWQYDLKGNFIKEFNSSKEVKDELGINIRSVISKGGSVGGFLWKRPSDDKSKVIVKRRKIR